MLIRHLLVLSLLFPLLAYADCDPGERVIKFSHVSSNKGHPKGEAAVAIAQRVNREMQGSACMQVFPRSQLFNDGDVLQALLLGDVQIAAPSLSKFEAYTKKMRIFDLPFLFDSMKSVEQFTSGQYGQQLLRTMEDKGIVGLSYIHNGMKQLSANRPILLPSDARGLVFRANNSDVTVAMYDALKAKGRKMPFKEVYLALETGVVDGQDNSWSNIYKNKFYEQQIGITETNHKILTYMAITSTSWLESLPVEIREQFLTIFKEESREANRRAFKINQQAKEAMLQQQVTIRQLTPEQRQQWKKVMRPVWEKFSQGIDKIMLDTAIALGEQ